jgi:hypothetical protein
MVRVRTLMAAVVVFGGIALFAVPATASVPAANAKFCTAAKKIGTGSEPTAAALSAFLSAAKSAPAKVKSAITTIVADLRKVIKSHRPDVSSGYKKAIVTYTTYYVKNCTAAP